MFELGSRVRTIKTLVGPCGAGQVQIGTLGTVYFTYKDYIEVRFDNYPDTHRFLYPEKPNLLRTIARGYFPTTALSHIPETDTLEGSQFKIEKDNHDGTYLVRKMD